MNAYIKDFLRNVSVFGDVTGIEGKADLILVRADHGCMHNYRLSSARHIQAAGVWPAGDESATVLIQRCGLQVRWCIPHQCIAQLPWKLTSLPDA